MKTFRNIFAAVAAVSLVIPAAGLCAEREHMRKERHEETEIVGEITAKIHGKIEKLPQGGLIGAWTVKGKKINVTKDTNINEKYGKIAIGVYVEVEGNAKKDAIDAFEIEVEKEMILEGKIEKLPDAGFTGTWIVAGKKVIVTPNTHIDEDDMTKLAVGVNVQIEGDISGDTVTADEVEVP